MNSLPLMGATGSAQLAAGTLTECGTLPFSPMTGNPSSPNRIGISVGTRPTPPRSCIMNAYQSPSGVSTIPPLRDSVTVEGQVVVDNFTRFESAIQGFGYQAGFCFALALREVTGEDVIASIMLV